LLNQEGCDLLRSLLERRQETGEKLGEESPVIAASPFYDRRGRFKEAGKVNFISTRKVSESIRQAVRASNFKWRPYVFRAYFDTSLMLAESRGRISHAYQQFWMGHKGDMDATYTTNKRRLPEHVLEDMRAAYPKAQEFIGTQPEPRPVDKIEAVLEAMRRMAEAYGIDPLRVRIERRRAR
jgi:hypothetical protein